MVSTLNLDLLQLPLMVFIFVSTFSYVGLVGLSLYSKTDFMIIVVQFLSRFECVLISNFYLNAKVK
jgi:hypothetical protein